MAARIFINYRRDDARDMAARVRDRLAGVLGDTNVFMDVDNLMAGQRFDKELEKALSRTDVFLSVIGPRWMELLAQRQASGERDYVREEIAAALGNGITVIPVLIERTPLPRADALPDDIRALVLHQKHVVTYEQFGRDVAGLVEAIRFARRPAKGAVLPRVPWAWVAASVAGTLALVYIGAHQLGVPVPWPWSPGAPPLQPTQEQLEAARQGLLMEQEAKRVSDATAADTAETKGRSEDAATPPVPRPVQVIRDCNDGCPELVVVPAGAFMMGSNDTDSEKPPHKVTIRQPFAVGRFEVTFAEWEACVAGGGCASNKSPKDQGWGRGRRPVIDVSWQDAKEYLAWLSRKTGKPYRLLSEAEWEYAARAGSSTKYAFGNTISKSQAQFSEGSWATARQTVEVGSFQPNRLGLHDMHGNVYEWVEDSWHQSYQGGPNDGSVWSGGDTSLRVVRGGSWYRIPDDLRSALRSGVHPGLRNIDLGFRVARGL